MKLSVDLLEARLVDMRVNLRGRKARVTEHFLDGAKVGPVSQQMGRERMTQEMRPDFFR